jgi:hypothetical protein
MSVDNINHRKHTALVVTSGVAGSIAGGIYARNHLSKTRTQAIDELNLHSSKWLAGLANTINIRKAGVELKKGTISEDEFTKLKDVKISIKEALKSGRIADIVYNTAKNDRTLSFEDAIKNEKEAHFKMRREFLSYSKKLQKNFAELGIFDSKKFMEVSVGKIKTDLKAYKIMAKPVAIGLAVGASIGALVGLGIKSLLNKD